MRWWFLIPLAAAGRTSKNASNRSDVKRKLFVTDDVPPFDGGALRPAQIKSDPLAPAGRIHRTAMYLQAAHAKQFSPGQTAHMFAGLDLAAERGSRDHDAVSLHYKCPVHRQPKVAGRRGLVATFECPGD